MLYGKDMWRFRKLLLLMMLGLLSGCAHNLEIRNLSDYPASPGSMLFEDLKIAIITPNDNFDGRLLVTGTAQALAGYVGKVYYPCTTQNLKEADIVSKIAVRYEHKAAKDNFFVSAPGFIALTPYRRGYTYYPSFIVDVTMTGADGKYIIDTFSIPINLEVRHASLKRTWDGLFAYGIFSGITSMTYDDDVTPLIEEEIKRPIGAFIAQEIIKRMRTSDKYVNKPKPSEEGVR